MLRWHEAVRVIERADKCVSAGNRSVSQVNVEPQDGQKPRVVPREDLNFAISPLVTL
jgi:hypothetical protein